MASGVDSPDLSEIFDGEAMEPIFNSFWMGGFEGADHVNGSGRALNPNAANGHDLRAEQDYAALAALGIRTVRESAGWRLLGIEGRAGLARLRTMASAAARHDVQIIWTLMHYGWPSHWDPVAREFEFAAAFATHCKLVCEALQDLPGPPPAFQPVNEISFLSWAMSATGLIHPHVPADQVRGFETKRSLVRAALQACDAIWAIQPRARIVHTDPLINIVPGLTPSAEERQAATRENDFQFQAWDMLAGRLCQDLGGHPRYLDVVGVNYYHGNQWELGSNLALDWHLNNPRRASLAHQIGAVADRYARPVLLAETGHLGAGRARWMDHVAEELIACAAQGVHLAGICLYPILDRPDWEDPSRWHQSGLWDLPNANVGDLTRVTHQPLAARLRYWQGAPGPWQAAQRCAPSTELAAFNFSSPRKFTMRHIVVFSHLRWDFVFQRPQQLLSRLAPHYPVVFVEEPLTDAVEPWLEFTVPCAGVTVLRAHVAGPAQGFHDDHLAVMQRLLSEYLADHGVTNYFVWFYTPMALPFANELTPQGIVYDCMDELTAFKFAPRQLIQRESALLKRADVVFTGGASLFESKKGRHHNVHCFPSSVDQDHFAPGSSDHPAQVSLAHPRLGYYGVIDERLDLDLIAALASAHTDWQIVMVGPVAKIDPAQLPQASNIHWLGQRPYAELPAFLAGWDVCLLPFALNDATRFISPTKTLEYLSAGKPAVSTAIRDVEADYAGLVPIARSQADFVRHCEAILGWDTISLASFEQAAAAKVATTSWDHTVQAMLKRLDAMAPHPTLPAALPSLPTAANDAAGHDATYFSTVVLGAGPTGLAAGLELGKGCLLLEREARVGGWCRSIEDTGFTFDHAGHIMFSTDPFVLDLYQRLLGDNMHWQNREAWIYSKEVYTRYPFQGALYGLPPKVLKECLVGAIEARFGPLKTPPQLNAATQGMAAPAGTAAPQNFEQFIYQVWGAGVAKHFAIPYNRKLWAVPLDQMETSWLGGRVPMPNLEEMIEGALEPVAKPQGPNARFAYPLRGGFQAMMDGFIPLLDCDLELNASVAVVKPSEHELVLQDGRRYRYDNLVSTMPLPKLVAAMGDQVPAEVRQAAAALRHVSVRCVNLGIGRENITDKHWIYYPEDTVFHRIFVQGNASPFCNAPGGFGLTCEITYSEYKELPVDGQALTDRCVQDCIRVGIIREDDVILASNQVDMPFAYVVYDHQRAAHVKTIRDWCERCDILLSGRYSEWEYYNSDHAFIAGNKVAQAVRARNLLRSSADDRPPVIPAVA